MVDQFGAPGVHAFVAIDRLQQRAQREVGALIPPDVVGLRGSHGRILDMIDDEGSRPTELARGAWISKQAIGQRVKELEQLGWVTIEPDPADRRAVRVRRSAEGNRVRRSAVSAIRRMEHEWADQVGRERYEVFRSVLDELGSSVVAPSD
jgi:DNA-binding MarR family transcriptional regulator